MEYTFDSFFGQIGEDDKLMREGQVLYSENLDLTSNSNFINISPLPQSLGTFTGLPGIMYFIERGVNKLVYTDGQNKVYVDGVEVYTSSNPIRGFWANSEYLFFIDSTADIYRASSLFSVGSTWGSVTQTETNLEADEGQVFISENENITTIAYGTKLYNINNATGDINDSFTFLFDEVVGLLDSRDILEVVQKNGIVFTWDRVDTGANSYDLNMNITKIIQSADKRYILSEGGYYIMSGGSLNKVAGGFISDELEQNKFNFRETTNIGFLKQVSYLSSDSITDIVDTGAQFIFGKSSVVMIGNKKSGFQTGISKFINTSSDGSKYDEIYGIVTKHINGIDYMYISYVNSNDIRGIDKVILSEQNYTTGDEGLLILPVFNGGSKKISKELQSLEVRCDFGIRSDETQPAGEFYFYKVEEGKLKPLVGNEISSSKISYSEGFGLKKLIVNSNFYDLTLAIVFKHTISNRTKNTALKLYSVTYNYNVAGN